VKLPAPVTTDPILMIRVAAELDRALRGARVTDVGTLDDGRAAVRFGGLRGRTRGAATVTLAIDIHGTPPLVTLEDEELTLLDAGWLRAAGKTLRGTRLGSVRSRPGDRVVVLAFSTASRFGVTSESRLVLELVPRFGNVVLLRDRVVLAAAGQFSPADNAARTVQVGMAYEAPPLPPPRLPRVLIAAAEIAGRDPDEVAREAEAAAAADGPLHVYRDAAGKLLAVHVVPLPQFPDAVHTQEPSLLDLFARARMTRGKDRADDAGARRRDALLTRIAKRTAAIAGERAGIDARLADVAGRDALRRAGDSLFTYFNDVPAGASTFTPEAEPDLAIALDPELDVKGNAAAYYAKYRKASNALPHLEARRDVLANRIESLEALAFEATRADVATLVELETALDELEGRTPRKRASATQRARPVLRVDRPSGARIYVGRSPRENVEVTFKIAKPDDLWFHARGIPGSHVVLQTPNGAEPEDEDLDVAANFAATHSKAKLSPRVEIDYTERKHVRKQRDGAPGLVWYTNARTRVGRPEL